MLTSTSYNILPNFKQKKSEEKKLWQFKILKIAEKFKKI